MIVPTRIHAVIATVLGTGAALACAGAVSAAENGGTAFRPQASPGRTALLGSAMAFRGEARRGTRIAVQRLEAGAWETVATARAGRSGRYAARWRTDRPGVFTMRAVPTGGAGVRASSVEDTVRVTVFRRAVATWYGRGWEGRRTACGQRITPSLMGVAHKTLPCGTRVTFLYRGRTVTVPVVDRGPYGRGISWDLTTAAAEELDFLATGRGTVGFMRASAAKR